MLTSFHCRNQRNRDEIKFELPENVLQHHHFQHQFFQNLTLNSKTQAQVQIGSQLLKTQQNVSDTFIN